MVGKQERWLIQFVHSVALDAVAGSSEFKEKVVERFTESAGFDYWAETRIRGYALLEATARSRKREDGERGMGVGGRYLVVGEEAICRCCRPVERNWPSSV